MNCVTERDTKLLVHLGEYGVLSTNQIKDLFFSETDKGTMLRRLRILEEMDLVRRIFGLADGSHGWVLTRKCASRIGAIGVNGRLNRLTLDHDVTLSQVRLALESVVIGGKWTPEHVLRYEAWRGRSPYSGVPENIPDALYTIEVNGNFVAVAIELEMTVKSTARYRKSLKAYRHKGQLGLVWFLVPTVAAGKRIERIWQELRCGIDDRRVRWSLTQELLSNPYDVVLHQAESQRLLRDITPMRPPVPAHPPAQGVGTVN